MNIKELEGYEEYFNIIKCAYCEDDGFIGDGRTPCPKCNLDKE